MAQVKTSDVEPKNVPGAEPSTDDISRQLEVLKSDIARLTDTIGGLGRAKGRHYADRARSEANALRGSAEDAYGEAELYVRQNPAMAMGIAAGFGLLVGLLTSRR